MRMNKPGQQSEQERCRTQHAATAATSTTTGQDICKHINKMFATLGMHTNLQKTADGCQTTSLRRRGLGG
jgi:hypothetical protein